MNWRGDPWQTSPPPLEPPPYAAGPAGERLARVEEHMRFARRELDQVHTRLIEGDRRMSGHQDELRRIREKMALHERARRAEAAAKREVDHAKKAVAGLAQYIFALVIFAIAATGKLPLEFIERVIAVLARAH